MTCPAAGLALEGWDNGTAYIGGFLPIAVANQNVDMVRKFQRNEAAMGGWLLYASDLLAREGYFGEGGGRRQVESARRRALASAVADVRLARGDWGPREARSYLQHRAGVGGEEAEAIVAGCAHAPGSACAAAIGCLELFAARDAYVRRGGAAEIQIVKFHDAMLAEGLVPPAMASQLVCGVAAHDELAANGGRRRR